MSDFTLHDIETAPADAKPLLQKSIDGFGMIPGLHAVMAEAPALLDGYQTLHKLFQTTSFDADELTVVWLSINVEHACHYCVPAHTGIANSMKVSADIVNALRDETPLSTAKLEALRTFTLAVLRERGNVTKAQLDAFYAAGYGQQQVLEVILGLAQKVMSNYVNHVAQTPVDKPFQKFLWEKTQAA
ncbi:MAG: carboxymuconolactone decarboxylase family protein [Rhodospirillales bacterium]|nr:carboxymuconolactone decarboxylase family protein [Rhodospirillales bacterium]